MEVDAMFRRTVHIVESLLRSLLPVSGRRRVLVRPLAGRNHGVEVAAS